MGLLEVVILTEQQLDFLVDGRLLQHILPYEIRKAVHFLHRDRLLEQIHGLHLPEAESLAKLVPVGRIIVESMHGAALLQLLAKGAHIRAGV